MRTEETKKKVIKELAEVINRNSLELETNTPDYVLAESMYMSLEATEKAINGRVDIKQLLHLITRAISW